MDLERALAKTLLKDENLEKIEPRVRPQNPASHWARPILMERAAYLKEMARFGDGSASEIVLEFPGHFAMLLFRSRSGEAEIDAKHAHLLVVLGGAATLVTGGKVKGARAMGPDETRGDSIEDGTEQPLRPGDVAHVPAGVPRQLLLTGEQTISCFVMKMEWLEEEKNRKRS
jgi:mannose-6-phosphate isomerase-like protein (cupin superfamily)